MLHVTLGQSDTKVAVWAWLGLHLSGLWAHLKIALVGCVLLLTILVLYIRPCRIARVK